MLFCWMLMCWLLFCSTTTLIGSKYSVGSLFGLRDPSLKSCATTRFAVQISLTVYLHNDFASLLRWLFSVNHKLCISEKIHLYQCLIGNLSLSLILSWIGLEAIRLNSNLFYASKNYCFDLSVVTTAGLSLDHLSPDPQKNYPRVTVDVFW